MATLQDVVRNNLTIEFGDIATSYLAKDQELCRQIQEILFENNFYQFDIDGIHGPITREALRDFKEAFALTGGDVLGPTTAEFLLKKDKLGGNGSDDFSTKQGTQRTIIRECKRQGLSLNSQIAYVLATVEHETNNTFQPVREAYWLSETWRKNNLWYYPYYGRGYVQLTHKSNYQKYKDILGVDLVSFPDKVMEPKIALFILVDGMARGRFTGKRLGQYINGNNTDFVGVRRVVNGNDKAGHIANLARNWQAGISSLESIEFHTDELVTRNGTELTAIEALLFKQIMSS